MNVYWVIPMSAGVSLKGEIFQLKIWTWLAPTVKFEFSSVCQEKLNCSIITNIPKTQGLNTNRISSQSWDMFNSAQRGDLLIIVPGTQEVRGSFLTPDSSVTTTEWRELFNIWKGLARGFSENPFFDFSSNSQLSNLTRISMRTAPLNILQELCRTGRKGLHTHAHTHTCTHPPLFKLEYLKCIWPWCHFTPNNEQHMQTRRG